MGREAISRVRSAALYGLAFVALVLGGATALLLPSERVAFPDYGYTDCIRSPCVSLLPTSDGLDHRIGLRIAIVVATLLIAVPIGVFARHGTRRAPTTTQSNPAI
jgi:hypothetical protein